MFDLMLDEDHVELEEVPEWIERVSRLTAGVANGPRDPQRRRQLTNALFLQDVGPELATEASRAGLSQPAFRTWLLTQSDEDINRMPALGIYREVFREKLLNPTTRWSPNDLLDMISSITAGSGWHRRPAGVGPSP